MVEAPGRVVAVVRHREHVLLCQPGVGNGSTVGTIPWAPREDDPEAALEGLLGELGVDPVAIERRGDPVEAGEHRWLPFLVAAGERDAIGGEPCGDPAWASPSALLGLEDERWWRAYATVAPTVETVAADIERGSAAIAVDALWVLRDAAAVAAARGERLSSVEATAIDLLDARPAMAALANRVNRAMAGAGTPDEVERAATDGIVRADEADATAARLAAATVDGGRVLTLSRSGTVRAALLDARPEVVVLASRPGGEGIAFARALAEDGLAVSTRADADVYACLRSGDVDAVLVGADAVTPDGGVVNKVGTRAAGLAAERAGIPCYAVCASDKIRPATEPGDTERPPLEPMFDWTPPRLVTALLTERGALERSDVRAIAEEHRRLARWRG